jgi:hypothetical protein
MVSSKHNLIVELFRDRPRLVAELLRSVLDLDLPRGVDVEDRSADFGKVVPTEYAADYFAVLTSPDRPDPWLGAIIEVQLRRDDRKRWSWPAYVANAHARHRCPTCLVVITPSPATAAWASQPIVIGPGSTVHPIVIGPGQVPPITDAARLRRWPELGVLSTIVHGRSRDTTLAIAVAKAAIRACARLDEERSALYKDVIEACLSVRAREKTAMLRLETHNWLGPTARKAEAKGIAKGEAKGIAKGEAKAKADDVLQVLEYHRLAVTSDQRAQILECRDVDLLTEWHRKALSAKCTADLFDGQPAPKRRRVRARAARR